ncbi:hypothetical protein [Nonomuraea guangzhouensis]|uniref:Uncharacterized protein n=1 Tax=Nonomuraea guangzhouensis TaxID=1291555 RepID=A0ABW4GT29_9ACTN|nr:hypothetical protein [Nonomuraea guangzhouensis]
MATAEQERAQARGTAAAHAEEADRLRQALAAEQQRREQAVTAVAVAQALLTKQDSAEQPGHPESAASSVHDAQPTNNGQQPRAAL